MRGDVVVGFFVRDIIIWAIYRHCLVKLGIEIGDGGGGVVDNPH